MEVDLISKKKDHKQNLVKSNDFNNGKIIFILLTKVVIFFIGPNTINIKGSSFELILKYSSF